MLGRTPEKLARRDLTSLGELGHILETFVVGELRKQPPGSMRDRRRGHWRTRDGHEVDLVLERDDGAILVFEVKGLRTSTRGSLQTVGQTPGRHEGAPWRASRCPWVPGRTTSRTVSS